MVLGILRGNLCPWAVGPLLTTHIAKLTNNTCNEKVTPVDWRNTSNLSRDKDHPACQSKGRMPLRRADGPIWVHRIRQSTYSGMHLKIFGKAVSDRTRNRVCVSSRPIAIGINNPMGPEVRLGHEYEHQVWRACAKKVYSSCCYGSRLKASGKAHPAKRIRQSVWYCKKYYTMLGPRRAGYNSMPIQTSCCLIPLRLKRGWALTSLAGAQAYNLRLSGNARLGE